MSFKNLLSSYGLFFGCLALLLGQQSFALSQAPKADRPYPFLIGGYGDGLYLSSLDSSRGVISPPSLVAKVKNASFFAHHPKLDVWYCVAEGGGEDGSVVVSFQATGNPFKLEQLTSQSSGGRGPCYVSVDAEGTHAFVANYGDGSVSMFPLAQDGALQAASDVVQHSGSSVNTARQREPHAHCAVVDPSDRWLLVPDLGIDLVKVYEIDRANHRLKPSPDSDLKLPAGSGPRHLTFHPNLSTLYVINELTSTIATVAWQNQTAGMKIIQIITTLPADSEIANTTAEILVHPTGKFVFGSNRGHDSIASFRVTDKDGTLELAGHCSTNGKTPRNFRIDPSGQFILAENQSSNSIQNLRLDLQNGTLSPIGELVSIPSPACIKFFEE